MGDCAARAPLRRRCGVTRAGGGPGRAARHAQDFLIADARKAYVS
jgi:hypothetical protein